VCEEVCRFEEKKRREACRRAVRERWYHETLTHALGKWKKRKKQTASRMHNPCSTRAPPPVPLLLRHWSVRTVVTTFCFSRCLIFPIRLPLSGCGTHGAEDRDDARGKRKEVNSYSCIGRTSAGDGSGRRSNETIRVFSSPACLFLARICPVTTEWSSCGTQ
jgi:hypothetical protein